MTNTFWALVSLIIFAAIAVYLRVPGMMGKSLDKRADDIRKELDEAKRLREEAEQLLADYQRRRREAEAEAANILKAAERDAALFLAEAKQKTEEYVARRTAMAEQKIRQAEQDATNEVRASAVDLAVAAAQKLLSEKADAAAVASLFNASVGELKRLN
ncbi:MAG: F0F1 ATP synthase subunit B [Pararhizobium sp.]